jgi:hypothetical protein
LFNRLYYNYYALRRRDFNKRLLYKYKAFFYYKLKRLYKGNKSVLKAIKAKGLNLLISYIDY